MRSLTLDLKAKIEKEQKKISDLQGEIDADIKFFNEQHIPYNDEETVKRAGYGFAERYYMLLRKEKDLTLAQQRLSSLLLESIKNSTDALTSSVDKMDEATEDFGRTAKQLLHSSRRLESVTAILFLVAVTTLAVEGLKLGPSSVAVIILGAGVLFILVSLGVIRGKEPKLNMEDASR
jgi:hypothetical protein